MSNNTYVFFKRETSKGTEVGIFPPKPDYHNKPITLRFDNDSDSIKFLESTLARKTEVPTMSMRYKTLTEDEIAILKSRLEGKTAMALNNETLTISKKVGVAIEDKLGLTLLCRVHDNVIQVTGSTSGLSVPDNYSAKAICTVYYELSDESYNPTFNLQHSRDNVKQLMGNKYDDLKSDGEVVSLDSALERLKVNQRLV